MSQFHRTIFLAAVVVHIITAWYSTGYHSADEHFQIVAFAQWKQGELPAEHLPWEFAERIRSSIQPWIATVVFKSASSVGIESPFNKAFLLRLLTALVTLLTVRGFVNATLGSMQEQVRKPYAFVSYFLWFLPFLHVRFAGEAWASICLLQGLSALYRNDDQRWPWHVGVWFTLAVCLRPGMLPAIGGIGLWILFIRKPKFTLVGKAVLAGIGVLLLTYGLDTLFYGQPTFSLGRYLDANFPSHPDHVFDAFPWWYYAPWIVKYALPPIGACMLIALVLYVIRYPRSVITWCTVPLLIALSIVPHKELRFLYGLVDLVPLILSMGLGEWLMNKRGAFIEWCFRFGLSIIIVINAIGLVVVMTAPAGEGRVTFAKELSKELRSEPAQLGYLVDPPIAWRIELPAFYEPSNVHEFIIDPNDPSGTIPHFHYLIAHPNEVAAFARARALETSLITRAEPQCVEYLVGLYMWHEGQAPWALYRVTDAPR